MTCRRVVESNRPPPMTDPSPGFEPDHVGSYPENPMRCLLYRDGAVIRGRINEAYGDESWDHAAYHAAGPVSGLAFVCVVGVPCGYDGDSAFMARLAAE